MDILNQRMRRVKLADRIRKCRKLSGMSQERLSDALDVSRSTIANWEGTDDITPTTDRLHKLAAVCNVSFEWLATGRGEINLPDYLHDVQAVQDLLVLEDPKEIRLVLAWRRAASKHQRTLLELAESHAPPRKPAR